MVVWSCALSPARTMAVSMTTSWLGLCNASPATGVYNARVYISQNTTTLYASDRDVFLFLVDDLNPIEAGRLPDGSADLYFRGFFCWNLDGAGEELRSA